jgi:type VI protein secretion system component Hcp
MKAGFPGESRDAAHKGEIDVSNFCFSGRAGKGGGATFGSFVIAKHYDRATPALLTRLAAGNPIDPPQGTTQVVVRKTGKAVEDVVSFKFGGTRVREYRQGAHAGDPLHEDLALSWNTVSMTTGGSTFTYAPKGP